MNRSLVVVLVVLSAAAGYFARGWALPTEEPPHTEDMHVADSGHDHDEEAHVALTPEAFATLRLNLAPVEVSDYVKTTAIPAEVAEFPGLSAYKLAAPVQGVVTAVAAEPGATVSPGDALFEVRITDERVLDAQLKLLESLTRLEIVLEELERLRPLAESGAVSVKQRRDLDFERRQLETAIRLRQDELVVRGLTEDQVAQLVDTKRLWRSVVVSVPPRAPPLSLGSVLEEQPAVRPVGWETESPVEDFSVERLLVEPGQTVSRGAALCDLASHAQLYLRVKAFERDVPLLASLAERGEPLTAEFGHSLVSHGPTSSLVDDLRVRYVANHVEEESQAYACYVPLRNELLHESTGPQGRRYRTWRFAVGQRAHLLLPIEQISGHFPLPIDAVAIEGANAMVFRVHEEEPEQQVDDPDHPDEQEHEEEHEFEPVSVTLLYRDNRRAVVSSGGELRPGDVIAMNAAYQLHLALESGGSDPGHHHHDH